MGQPGRSPNTAVAWDNYFLGGLGACGVYDTNGNWVQKFNGDEGAYSTVNDPAWTDAIIAYARAVKDRLHALPVPVRLIPNATALIITGDAARTANFINAVDGVLIEGGYFGPEWVGDNSRQLWLRSLRFVEQLQAAGKAYYSIEIPLSWKPVTPEFRQFVLASYLLVKGHSAALDIPIVDGGNYDTQLDYERYPEFNVRVGTPCAPMFQAAGSGENGVWMREHTGGVSLVNGSVTSSFTVALPAGSSYRDVYGNSVGSSVNMAPDTGLILLRNNGGGCSAN
jgi:hypothetical protein